MARRNVGGGVDVLTPMMESFCLQFAAQSPEKGAGMRAVQACGSAAAAPNAASAQASEWLSMPKIQARIAELRAQSVRRNPAIITRDELLAGLSILFKANLTDYQTAGADGGWCNVGPESPNTLALQSITTHTTEGGTVVSRVSLADKVRTAERIARMQGWDKQADAQPPILVPVIFVIGRGYQAGRGQIPERATDVIEGERTDNAIQG